MVGMNLSSLTVIALTLFQVCQTSLFDKFMGFGENAFDMMNTFNGIKSNPAHQCRIALAVMHREDELRILSNALCPLEELVTGNDEFRYILNEAQKVKMLDIYISHLYLGVNFKPIDGEALEVIMTVLHKGKAFDLIKLALDKNILSVRGVLIYFLKYRRVLLDSVKAGVLEHVDITTSILAGKGILHVLLEKGGDYNLIKEILNIQTGPSIEKIKKAHFTKIEGNSILHSAVLSNNPKIIEKVVRDFNCFCGHINNFGMSPLKLALANGCTFETINTLLDHGCTAYGEVIFNRKFEHAHDIRYKKFDEFKHKLGLSKFLPITASNLIKNFEDADRYHSLPSTSASSADYYLMGLLNSTREFYSSFDRASESSFVESPKSTQNLREIWSILTTESHEHGSDLVLENLPVQKIINFMDFSYSPDPIKKQVLANLSKLESLDFTGVNLNRFIQILIQFADPTIFARFVHNYLDYYFCVRSIFKYYGVKYGITVPFLVAIGFDVNVPFVDGIYPVHLAAKTNNYELLKFLITRFGADLTVRTVYEGNNILHYGLNDNANYEMTEYLLNTVPDLLVSENIFSVTPLQSSLMAYKNFDSVTKVLKTYEKIQIPHSNDFEYLVKNEKIFNEIISNWPKYSSEHSRRLFTSIYETCGSDEISRLILNFASKKLLKHFINEQESQKNLRMIQYQEYAPSPSFEESPTSVADGIHL